MSLLETVWIFLPFRRKGTSRPFYNVDYVFRPLDEPSYRLAKIIIEPEIKKKHKPFPDRLSRTSEKRRVVRQQYAKTTVRSSRISGGGGGGGGTARIIFLRPTFERHPISPLPKSAASHKYQTSSARPIFNILVAGKKRRYPTVRLNTKRLTAPAT